MVNLKILGPSKQEPISEHYDQSIAVNRIACGDGRAEKENMDSDFGMIWKQALHGGEIPQGANPN